MGNEKEKDIVNCPECKTRSYGSVALLSDEDKVVFKQEDWSQLTDFAGFYKACPKHKS